MGGCVSVCLCARLVVWLCACVPVCCFFSCRLLASEQVRTSDNKKVIICKTQKLRLTFPKNGFVTIGVILWDDEGVDNVAKGGKGDAALGGGSRSGAEIKGSTTSTGADDGVEAIIAIAHDLAGGL